MSNLTAAEQQALNDMEAAMAAKENDGDSQAVEREITLLESWLSVLSNAEGARGVRATPSETIAGLSRHAGLLTLADIPAYFDQYYELLTGAYDIVRAQVEDNVEAVNVSKEDDAELNWKHYANIYMLWRQHLMTAEREWNITNGFAAAHLAALHIGVAQGVQAGELQRTEKPADQQHQHHHHGRRAGMEQRAGGDQRAAEQGVHA